jgi:hypothetical protein
MVDSFLTHIPVYAIPTALALIILAIIVGGWIICPLFVLFSSRSHGGAKFGWFIITLLFSWLGFAIFLIVTQKPQKGDAAKTSKVEPHF